MEDRQSLSSFGCSASVLRKPTVSYSYMTHFVFVKYKAYLIRNLKRIVLENCTFDSNPLGNLHLDLNVVPRSRKN